MSSRDVHIFPEAYKMRETAEALLGITMNACNEFDPFSPITSEKFWKVTPLYHFIHTWIIGGKMNPLLNLKSFLIPKI